MEFKAITLRKEDAPPGGFIYGLPPNAVEVNFSETDDELRVDFLLLEKGEVLPQMGHC